MKALSTRGRKHACKVHTVMYAPRSVDPALECRNSSFYGTAHVECGVECGLSTPCKRRRLHGVGLKFARCRNYVTSPRITATANPIPGQRDPHRGLGQLPGGQRLHQVKCSAFIRVLISFSPHSYSPQGRSL